MKLNRTWIFMAVSSAALVTVLVIQVNWILQTAKIKEDLFNEKAGMVLSKTSEAISADKQTCRNLQTVVGKSDIQKIDSLFAYYMRYYNFRIHYSFEVKPGLALAAKKDTGFMTGFFPAQPGGYKKSLYEIVNENGFELKLAFPQKEQFIWAEMGIPFFASVALIIVVLVMYWRTILSLMREKKVSEHTTDFVNNMTHEFKTPLTNIALAGKMIIKASHASHQDKIVHYSGIILEENEKLRLQVEQVLSMTALERGDIPLQKTELDFNKLICDSLKSMSIQIENKQGQIKLNLAQENFTMLGDKTHLTNALCNLIDNAIKYSPDKPDISVQTFGQGKNVVIIVADKGTGIEKKYQKKVFEKFFRVPTGDVHDVKGFGLGLAYVKMIIAWHGGSIELQSEKGNGTTFTITLPHA